jgi:hypothetical protein
MKKLLIFLSALFLVACGSEESQTEPEPVKSEEVEEQAKQEENNVTEEVEEIEEDTIWDDVKNQDKIVGKSDKDFSELSNSKPTEVRNDTTGNWRVSTLSENVDIIHYALSYHDLHMSEGEVHHIVNFGNDTTTWLNNIGGILYVDIKERVDGEEHDASTLGSGMVLKSYAIYPDGDIEEIK